MNTPTRMIRYIQLVPLHRYCEKEAIVCDNGQIYTRKGISKVWEMTWEKIKKRIRSYGFESPYISYQGRIPTEISKVALDDKVEPKSQQEKREEIGAVIGDGGCLLTRSGKMIPPNSNYDNSFYASKPAREDYAIHERKKAKRPPVGNKKEAADYRPHLYAFNAKMRKKGLLRAVEFTEPKTMGGVKQR